MTRSVEEQMADIERRMKQLRARKQRIVARENAKARKRRTHLIIRLGGILSNEGVLGYDEGVWNDEGNRQRLLDMLKAHAAELRAWASDAGVRLPSAESAGELREQVRDLPQEPQIQEQPGYGYQPGFQQPQQWQQQPWRKRDGEDDDPWENHGPDGYQPPSYEPVNPERRTAQPPSDGLI